MKTFKYLGMVTGLLVFAGGVYLYTDRHTPLETGGIDKPVKLQGNAGQSTNSEAENKVVVLLPAQNTLAPVSKVIVTEKQKDTVTEQEKELLGLARKYDVARIDPDKRAEYRQEIEAKLAAYSNEVLPVALEKIESMRAAN